jgi:septum formation protein
MPLPPRRDAQTLILASASPRRRDLLAQLGIAFEVHEPHLDERGLPGESPRDQALRLAQAKASEAAKSFPGRTLLAADTLVALGDRVLGKPRDSDEARAFLRLLSGNTHLVHTAVCVCAGGASACRTVTTEVTFRPLSEPAVSWYLGTGEPMGKAGAYAIQGRGGAFVAAIRGSYSNVVGLPLVEATELLAAAGVALPWQ